MVNAVNAGTNVAPQADTGGTSLEGTDFDTYLKLLVTQLENQDPLDPMDSDQFTQQLATFSSLEQQILTNDLLKELAQESDFSAQNLAMSYLDKQVMVPTEFELEAAEITLFEGESGPYDFAFTLDGPASSSTVEIRNAQGELVRTLEGGKNPGVNEMSWDFLDDNGTVVAAGDYTIQVSARNNDGERVAHRLYTYERVVSVSGEAGNPILNMADGTEARLDDVLKVKPDETVLVYQPNGGGEEGEPDAGEDSNEEG